MSTMAKDTNKAINNPWFWGWTSLLLIVLTVNGIFIYFAYTTNPGLVTDDYYDRGQAYEANMIKRQKNSPKWTMDLAFQKPLMFKKETTFSLISSQKEFDSVVFYAYRPSDINADFSIPMQPNLKGKFQTNVTFPLKGKWDIIIQATKGDKSKNESLTLFVKDR